MANFISQEVQNTFTDVMNKLRDDIGRNVTVISAPSEIDCPNCNFDSVKNKSGNKYEPTDPYPTQTLIDAGISPTGPIDFPALGMRVCPVCNGKGKLVITPARESVNCLISLLTQKEAEFTELGKNYKTNFELQTEISNYALFKNAQKVIVDGQVAEIVAVNKVGIGTLSQIIVRAGTV